MKSCPRINFKRTDLKSGTVIEAFADHERVGLLTLREKNSVSLIEVEPGFARCGVGTRLYEKAARIACAEGGTPLRSDVYRTAASQGFWEKQVRVGRAICAGREHPEHGGAEEALVGRGNCLFYKLTCPAPKSLRGARAQARGAYPQKFLGRRKKVCG